MFPAVVLELEVDTLLADQIELIAVFQLPEPGVFCLQRLDPGAQLLHFPGIPEVNDQMDTFLFH